MLKSLGVKPIGGRVYEKVTLEEELGLANG
jgi:hypothetical protein